MCFFFGLGMVIIIRVDGFGIMLLCLDLVVVDVYRDNCMMGEFDLIWCFFLCFVVVGVEVGVGDDCVVFVLMLGVCWLVFSDMLVEGWYFLFIVDLVCFGYKVLVVNFSDLVVCGVVL